MSNFLFVSANHGGGGSEELWVQTARSLSDLGHNVSALTEWHNTVAHRRDQLESAKIDHHSLANDSPLLLKAARKFLRLAGQDIRILVDHLKSFKPDLVVFNSGTLLDGLPLLKAIISKKYPCIVVTHLVSTDNWPNDTQAALIRDTYSSALETYFVSEHNRHLFFLQTGDQLSKSKIIRNPFLVSQAISPMPAINDDTTIRLALPARLHPRTKGQDLLFDVLSRKHWRERRIQVSLFGTGSCERTLKMICTKLELDSIVTFAGHVDDMNSVWNNHHGLVLPSRHEGLPIAQIEAMWAGRVIIATPAGGIPEMILPGKTGFLATACHADALDTALCEAWARLAEWQSIGEAAHYFISKQIPYNPALSWAGHLISIVKQSKGTSAN